MREGLNSATGNAKELEIPASLNRLFGAIHETRDLAARLCERIEPMCRQEPQSPTKDLDKVTAPSIPMVAQLADGLQLVRSMAVRLSDVMNRLEI